MKTCKKCKYFTGVQCHGHGDFWGKCKKNKNDLFCYEDSPCLQDVKTLRELYFKQKDTISKLEYEIFNEETWRTRYEINNRHLNKVKNYWYIAIKHISKENYKKYQKEIIEYLKNEKI